MKFVLSLVLLCVLLSGCLGGYGLGQNDTVIFKSPGGDINAADLNATELIDLLNPYFLLLDTSNDPLSGNLDVGDNNITGLGSGIHFNDRVNFRIPLLGPTITLPVRFCDIFDFGGSYGVAELCSNSGTSLNPAASYLLTNTGTTALNMILGNLSGTGNAGRIGLYTRDGGIVSFGLDSTVLSINPSNLFDNDLIWYHPRGYGIACDWSRPSCWLAPDTNSLPSNSFFGISSRGGGVSALHADNTVGVGYDPDFGTLPAATFGGSESKINFSVVDIFGTFAGNESLIFNLQNDGYIVLESSADVDNFDFNSHNVQVGVRSGCQTNIRIDGNITLCSPDATEWNCGVDNSGVFSCN